MRSGASRAQCGRYEQIVPLTLSLIRDCIIRVPPSLLVTSISVDGIGIGQYGAKASCLTVDITGVPPSMAATARLRHFAGFRAMRTNIWQPSLAFLSLGLQIIVALHLAPRSTAAWNARSKMATPYCASVSISGNRATFVT